MATISFDEKVVVTDPEMVEKMKRDIEGGSMYDENIWTKAVLYAVGKILLDSNDYTVKKGGCIRKLAEQYGVNIDEDCEFKEEHEND